VGLLAVLVAFTNLHTWTNVGAYEALFCSNKGKKERNCIDIILNQLNLIDSENSGNS